MPVGKEDVVGSVFWWSLSVIAILAAILAAIAAPTLLKPIRHGEQKRTMEHVRTVALAVQQYARQAGSFPRSEEWTDVESLRPLLQPTYIKNLPAKDGWTNAIQYRSEDDGYTVRSRGKDGQPDVPQPSGATSSLENDILFHNGRFVAYPEGTQGPGRGE